MPKKLSVKKIIELDNAGMSGIDIAIALSISRNSVAEVLNTYTNYHHHYGVVCIRIS